jgi:hypothetical protein
VIASGMMAACLVLADGMGWDGRAGAADSGRAKILRPAAGTRSTRGAMPAGRLSARWIGQDGRDLVGPSTGASPNDVQDVHILLGGLPPRREVATITLTGHGQHQWLLNTPRGSWGLALVREAGARTADLFIEPLMVETGREFHLEVVYDDGTRADLNFRGGRANPNLRMPRAALAVAWLGQDEHDRVGAGPGVGPDGIQDVRLALSRISTGPEVTSAEVRGPGGLRWRSGPDQQGYPVAEFLRDAEDRSRAVVHFQPAADLAGQTLSVTLNYPDGKTDTATVVARAIAPRRSMPSASLPNLISTAVTARWVGQDRARGDVHVALDNLPGDREVAAAVLSDSVQGLWIDRGDGKIAVHDDPGAMPLAFKRAADLFRADLHFPPVRDETGATMTLRLIFRDGATAIAQFPGGPCDPSLGAPAVAATSAVAKPGDDLNDLANRFGTVRLSSGTYRLSKPLVLGKPVTLAGDPGATLLFSQAAGDPAWTAAIKVHRGSTTLRGFAVRFSGPIRWRPDVSFGPAVIGTTDNLDAGAPDDPKKNLTIAGLDLEGPPADDPSGWADAPRLLRLVSARSGRIEGNRLRGGPIEVVGGPWQVVDNDYRGTPPGLVSPCVVAAHGSHDLLVKGNRARPEGRSGKTWRFLVMTNRGAEDRVEDNVIEGIGPRDDDTIPWANAPEIVLTESYRLCYEGKLAAASPDGRVVKVHPLQGETPRVGYAVAALAGKHAGRWCRIAQVIDPTTYVLDAPLPRGAEWVSVAEGGFVRETFQGNTIDARGGRRASGLVLAGNHFGTQVLDNRLLGGEAFRIAACASERPGPWGWSHVPFLGVTVAGNTIEDAEQGAIVGVDHGPAARAGRGRTYMTVALRDNTVLWSDEFLARLARDGRDARPPGLVVGSEGSIDPGELVIKEEGDRLQAPSGTPPGVSLKVVSAVLNGRETVGRGYALPASPSTAAASGAKIKE